MLFTKEHEWVEVKGSVATVGISAFAQKQLGDIVSIELPSVGSTFSQGQSFAIVDSMKASSDVYAPVSGEVVEVNKDLLNNPQWINEDPYGKGWIAKIKVSGADELKKLMKKEEYGKFTGES